MMVGALIGLVLGILGALAGIAAMLWGQALQACPSACGGAKCRTSTIHEVIVTTCDMPLLGRPIGLGQV